MSQHIQHSTLELNRIHIYVYIYRENESASEKKQTNWNLNVDERLSNEKHFD